MSSAHSSTTSSSSYARAHSLCNCLRGNNFHSYFLPSRSAADPSGPKQRRAQISDCHRCARGGKALFCIRAATPSHVSPIRTIHNVTSAGCAVRASTSGAGLLLTIWRGREEVPRVPSHKTCVSHIYLCMGDGMLSYCS